MKAFAVCDKGKTRATNEDTFAINYCCDYQYAVLIVCDGMGGANAGNIASKFACETFLTSIQNDLLPDMQPETVYNAMEKAIKKANDCVYQLSVKQKEFQGMGTTLVAAICCSEYQIIVNVGDSRAYKITPKYIAKITSDHSYLEEMVRRGKMTPKEAEEHPAKNLITRAVGVDPFVEADYYILSLKDQDKLLLCSDGLTGLVKDEQIFQIIQTEDDLEKACEILKDTALNYGGHDNITALLFSLKPSPLCENSTD